MTIDNHSNLEKVAQWYSNKEGFMSQLVKYSFKSLQPYFKGSSCLELGAADGQMTGMLIEDFKNVTSVDGSSTYCKKIRTAYDDIKGLKIVCSLFEEYYPKDYFDTIIATRVLEHLEDPVSILGRIRDWLKPEGVLIVLVPNARSFHRMAAVKMGLLESPESLNELDVKLGHHRVYNTELLISHLKRSGWCVVTTGGIFFKPLTNIQMEQWFTQELMDGFYELGHDFPENAAEIFAVCNLSQSSPYTPGYW